MLNVYWGDKVLCSCSREKETLLQEYCAENNVPCQINEAGDYLLYPALKGTIVSVCQLFDKDEDMEKVVRSLSGQLSTRGAVVLFNSSGISSLKVMKILNVQILLSFNKAENTGRTGFLRFFYSLKKKQESLDVVAAIIKELAHGNNELSYGLPTLCDYLWNLKYYRIYISDVPTVLIEVNGLQSGQIECLEKSVLLAILAVFGQKVSQEETKVIRGLVDLLQKQEEKAAQEGCAQVRNEKDDVNLMAWNEEQLIEAIKHEELCHKEGAREEKKVQEEVEEDEEEDLFLLEPEMSLMQTPRVNAEKYSPQNDSKKTGFQVPLGSLRAKKRHYYKGGSTFFVPGEGPVYQFVAPARAMQEKTRILSPGAHEARSVFSRGDEVIPKMPWQQSFTGWSCSDIAMSTKSQLGKHVYEQCEYNAIKELRNLAAQLKREAE